MPYVVINTSNYFDPSNNARCATQAQADALAKEVLLGQPSAKIYVAQVIKEYSAHVSIIAEDPIEADYHIESEEHLE